MESRLQSLLGALAVSEETAERIVSTAQDVRAQLLSGGAPQGVLYLLSREAVACLDPLALGLFWHAFVQCVAQRELCVSDAHPFVFVGSDGYFEVTDEWGQGWFLVVSPCDRSATPTRASSPLSTVMMGPAYLEL